MIEGKDSEEQVRNKIRTLFQTRTGEKFETQYANFCTLKEIFHAEMAKALQPLLNQEAAKKPIRQLSDKRKIAAWIMDLLRPLNLAIQCPKTGEPAAIVADISDPEYDLGRFRLEITNDRGKRSRPYSSKELPTLQLREDRVHYSRHHQSSRSGNVPPR